MAYTEILSAHNLTVEQWNSMIFQEYLGQLWWSTCMGTSMNAAIQVKEDLMKQPGDAVTFGIRSQLKGGHVVGNAKGIGNEGRVDFYDERVVIDNDRQLVKFEDIPMSQKRTNFNLLQQGREALQEKAIYQLEDDITDALVDTSEGRVQGRYLYGAADSNYNATEATAKAAVDATNDQLTTRMISIAKRKALIPVNANTKVRPLRIRNGERIEEWFKFVGHTYCIRDMVDNDAAWRNAQLNIPPGSHMSNPIFSGSWFLGSWRGTLVYEFDRLPLETNTNSDQIAHNLLLGAQACILAWGQRSQFGEEEADVGHDLTYELHEIRGLQKVVWGRAAVDPTISADEDHGVVHVYASAAGD